MLKKIFFPQEKSIKIAFTKKLIKNNFNCILIFRSVITRVK